MSWNYRVVVERHVPTGEDLYSVREVYYTKRGKIKAWTDPVDLDGFESVMDLLSSLSRSLLRLRTKRTGSLALEEVYQEKVKP